MEQQQLDVDRITEAVLAVTRGPAALHAPTITEADVEAVAAAARQPASYEPTDALETELEALTGRPHAVATSSGTAALHVALLAVGVKPGDVVIVPTMAFAAVAAAVRYCGAFPVFIDADLKDYGLSPKSLESFLDVNRIYGKPHRIKAVIVAHIFGHPCKIEEISEICDVYEIPLIEDAAEAVGSEARDMPCGSCGSASVLSFNLNKTVTGGGGGALLTSDERIADKARALISTARIHHPWLVDHFDVGFNYRIPSMCAAMALSQLRRLPEILKSKRALARVYAEVFHDAGFLSSGRFFERSDTKKNYWLNLLQFAADTVTDERDRLLTALHAKGLMARAAFTPLHRISAYSDPQDRRHFPIADEIHRTAICLPSGVQLGERYRAHHGEAD